MGSIKFLSLFGILDNVHVKQSKRVLSIVLEGMF